MKYFANLGTLGGNLCWRGNCGSFFLWSLALKLSIKSHQITIYFIQIDEVFTKTKSFLLNTHFWLRRFVIWWLINDKLRGNGREPEKKKPLIPCLPDYLRAVNICLDSRKLWRLVPCHHILLQHYLTLIWDIARTYLQPH